jgi:hypothetical protein
VNISIWSVGYGFRWFDFIHPKPPNLNQKKPDQWTRETRTNPPACNRMTCGRTFFCLVLPIPFLDSLIKSIWFGFLTLVLFLSSTCWDPHQSLGHHYFESPNSLMNESSSPYPFNLTLLIILNISWATQVLVEVKPNLLVF